MYHGLSASEAFQVPSDIRVSVLIQRATLVMIRKVLCYWEGFCTLYFVENEDICIGVIFHDVLSRSLVERACQISTTPHYTGTNRKP